MMLAIRSTFIGTARGRNCCGGDFDYQDAGAYAEDEPSEDQSHKEQSGISQFGSDRAIAITHMNNPIMKRMTRQGLERGLAREREYMSPLPPLAKKAPAIKYTPKAAPTMLSNTAAIIPEERFPKASI
jgi:hypothetical protein